MKELMGVAIETHGWRSKVLKSGLYKLCLEGMVECKRSRGRKNKKYHDKSMSGVPS